MPLRKTSAKEITKHIKGFVDELNLDKVHLLGNSLGGHVALIFTKNHLERVASMTLTASSGLYEMHLEILSQEGRIRNTSEIKFK